ncbi:hypothetical protein HYC85_013469 [Camellia sinensis]|uniref:Uncharacterized protein n=1 Tax=Camellia sinensis TaxID=4442 RepID=A0A7J7H3F5_CAMSI|nr:hypothetical protein HYC85_013469 [Camellia sinensis]
MKRKEIKKKKKKKTAQNDVVLGCRANLFELPIYKKILCLHKIYTQKKNKIHKNNRTHSSPPEPNSETHSEGRRGRPPSLSVLKHFPLMSKANSQEVITCKGKQPPSFLSLYVF